MEKTCSNIRQKRLIEAYEYARRYYGIHTQEDFAQYVGHGRNSMSSALNGQEKYLTNKLLEKVADKFVGIFNREYLLNGEGQLLTPEEEISKANADDRTSVIKPEPPAHTPEVPNEMMALLDRALSISRRNEEMVERLAGTASQNRQTEIAIEKVANNLNESQQQVLQIRSDILAVTESINKFKATFDNIREENQKLRASNDILVQRLDKAVTLFDDISTKVAHILANQRYPEPPATINIASEP